MEISTDVSVGASYLNTLQYKLIYIIAIDDKDHKGFLKIGDATLSSSLSPEGLPANCDALNQAARKRIDEYTRTAMIHYELLHTELAVCTIRTADGKDMFKSFRDYDVHAVLDRSGILCKKFHTTDRTSEWYQVDLPTAILAIEAVKKGQPALLPREKGRLFDTGFVQEPAPIILRDEQQEAVEKTLRVFRRDRYMLWNCKMRFGKTVSAYELMKEGHFQKSIVVTHRPVVEEGWRHDHDLIFGGKSDHLFIAKDSKKDPYEFDAAMDRQNERQLLQCARSGHPFVYFVSMQDLRGSRQAGGKFQKNEAVFAMDWDLIIYDEAHEGTQTDLGKKVRDLLESPKKGKEPKVLSLSGTPYNIIDQYGENNVYTWDYVMERMARERFALAHPDEVNPYEDLPEMRILTFDLSEVFHNAYQFESEDMAFNFTEFFRTWTGDPEKDFRSLPQGAHIGDFVHPKDVRAFLDLITKDSKDSQYPFSNPAYRDMFRHTFWMVPGVKEARALSRMLKEHPVFSHFGIANVAGDGDFEEAYDDALKKVQDVIAAHDYTITISCGKLTTGVTVPEWTAVMMLAGSANTAAAGYMQTIFRVQSVGTINGRQKKTCFVFDFAPDRALRVLPETFGLGEKSTVSDDEKRARIGEFLNYCPVLSVEGTRMIHYDVMAMMRQVKRLSVDKAIRNGFEDESIYKEGVGLVMKKGDLALFKELSDVVSGQGKSKRSAKVVISRNGLTEEEYDRAEKAKNKRKKERTEAEKEALRKEKELKKEREKKIRLLRAVSIRLPLLIYGADGDFNEKITLQYFVDHVDKESWEEFMPKGLKKDLFKKLLRFYDEDVVTGAGLRIRHLARAADDMAPSLRVRRLAEIFSYFRNPDKETVLTPWRVVNMQMGNTLGGWNFYDEKENWQKPLEKPLKMDQPPMTADVFNHPGSRLLEINAKSGLYSLYLAYSRYAEKLAGMGLREEALPLEEAKRLFRETVEEDIYILCKSTMARSIARRTLAGYEPWKVNAVYIPHLLDRWENDQKRLANKICNGKTWEKEGEKLKFDAVVGNPPYQKTGGSGGTNDAPVYQEFAMMAEAIGPRYISLIMPARWFSGGREGLLGEFRRHMIENRHIRKMFVYVNSRYIFQNVEIKGGVMLLFDRSEIRRAV